MATDCLVCGNDAKGKHVLPSSERETERDDGQTVVAFFHEDDDMCELPLLEYQKRLSEKDGAGGA